MNEELDYLLKQWGHARRKVNGIQPPPRSIFGKFTKEEGGPVAAASRGLPSPPPEVLLNDALLVSRAIRTAIDDHKLDYYDHETLTAHYVFPGHPRIKAKSMGIPRSTYYSRLESAKNTLAPYICALQGARPPQID